MKVIKDVFPQRDNISEKEACTHIGGSAAIMVDVYLHSGWSAVEETAQDGPRLADCDDEPLSSTTGRYNEVD